MKAEYDKETDTLNTDHESLITDHHSFPSLAPSLRPGVIADFGYDGGVVGFEILHASKVVEQAGEMQFAVAGH